MTPVRAKKPNKINDLQLNRHKLGFMLYYECGSKVLLHFLTQKGLMSKLKQQLAQATKVTIFSGTDVIVQIMCGNEAEINAVLAQYSDPQFTYKLSSFNYVV